MINIKEELKKYESINIESDTEYKNENSIEEIEEILTIFTKSYERIGKEQYKTSNSIDEILDMLEEHVENNQEKLIMVKEFQDKVSKRDNELKNVLNTIVNISDIFDYINMYVSNSDNEKLKVQFNLAQEQLTEKLAKASITVLGTLYGEVDIDIHKPIETRWEEDRKEGVILQVVRKGYMYNGQILRKAEVVINKA